MYTYLFAPSIHHPIHNGDVYPPFNVCLGVYIVICDAQLLMPDGDSLINSLHEIIMNQPDGT